MLWRACGYATPQPVDWTPFMLELNNRVLSYLIPEDCSCHCSSSGCLFIHAILKEGLRPRELVSRGDREFDNLGIARDLEWIRAALRALFEKHLKQNEEVYPMLSLAIIRFETFQRLELTHTCCIFDDSNSWFCLKSEDERYEIQDEERHDIEQLEGAGRRI